MAMGVGGAGEYKSDINITPLVDVVLVLLIIFMVITPLLQMGYDVKVPPKSTSRRTRPPPTDLIIVSLTPANKIYLNKDEVNAQTLSLRLTEILKNRANKTIFFSGRRRAPTTARSSRSWTSAATPAPRTSASSWRRCRSGP